MPRFYLNLFNSIGAVPDDEGVDLPDRDAARRAAIDSIRSIVAEDARKGLLDFNGRIEVADGTGQLLFTVTFAEAFDTKRFE